jgi:hypothetical protein
MELSMLTSRLVIVTSIMLCISVAQARDEGRPLNSSPDFRGSHAQQEACKPDVFRLCGHAIPDVTNIVACLRHNRAQLSPACRTVFSQNTR